MRGPHWRVMTWAVLLLPLMGCSSSEPAAPVESAGPEMQTLRGTVGPAFSDCVALQGAAVLVTDEAGTVIATTSTSNDTNGPGNGCLVEFSVDVPQAEFYTLKVGLHEGPTYSRTDLEEADWMVSLTLS